MAWIRLSDNYIDHPKFEPLSDGAFRLWHELMAYCRRHQTDGLIPKATMLRARSYRSKRLDELLAPAREHLSPLVEKVDRFGFKIHDYLEWNPAKDEENERRSESKERMRQLREERRTAKGIPPIRAPVSTNMSQTDRKRSHDVRETRSLNVLDMDTDKRVLVEREHERKPDAPSLESRASRLREELYPAWYAQYRHGAKLRIPLIVNTLEFQDALSLVQTWDDARIEKLARIVLTTDESFIAGTDRSFKIFAMKASWADDRLSEIEHGRAS